MRPQLQSAFKLTAAVLVTAVTLGWLINRAGSGRHSHEQVWFYDESEKRLYPAAADIPPPDKGIAGKKNDGVRAIVVAFPGERNDSRHQRIAYLQTYTPELKTTLKRVQAAHAAGKRVEVQVPSRDSDFFQTNTLVRRPDEPTWQPSNSAEAQRITSEWRSWRGPDGQPPILVTP
jgi:hypothetical protein